MTKISLTYCGMPGSGETVKAAKQDAAARIETLLDDLKQPVIVRWRDHAVLVYRSLGGWDYQCLFDINDGECFTSRTTYSCCMMSGTFDETLRSAIQHLADVVRREGEMEIPDIITKSGLRPTIIHAMSDEYTRRGKQDDINRQRGREADALGLTDGAKYAYILGDPRVAA